MRWIQQNQVLDGRTNIERSSPPFLTVLLLLTGEHIEEDDGLSSEGKGPLRECTPQEFFFENLAVVWGPDAEP